MQTVKGKKVKKILEGVLYPLLAVAAIIVVWYIAAAVTDSTLILPTPRQTLDELIRYLTLAEFYKSFLATLLRSLVSFIIAVALSFLTAALALVCRPIKLFLKTLVSILRSVPTISMILLLIIWTNSQVAPIIVALTIIYPTLYQTIIAALEGIDPALEETAKIYAVPLYKKIIRIYTPLCAPNYLQNAAGALSLNLKLVIAAEVLAQTVGGIGLMMQLNQIYFETGRLLALTIAVVAVSFVLENIILLAKKHWCNW